MGGKNAEINVEELIHFWEVKVDNCNTFGVVCSDENIEIINWTIQLLKNEDKSTSKRIIVTKFWKNLLESIGLMFSHSNRSMVEITIRELEKYDK